MTPWKHSGILVLRSGAHDALSVPLAVFAVISPAAQVGAMVDLGTGVTELVIAVRVPNVPLGDRLAADRAVGGVW